jgi:hypothetical protein
VLKLVDQLQAEDAARPGAGSGRAAAPAQPAAQWLAQLAQLQLHLQAVGGTGGVGAGRPPPELGWSLDDARALLPLADEDVAPEALMRRFDAHVQMCSPLLL